MLLQKCFLETAVYQIYLEGMLSFLVLIFDISEHLMTILMHEWDVHKERTETLLLHQYPDLQDHCLPGTTSGVNVDIRHQRLGILQSFCFLCTLGEECCAGLLKCFWQVSQHNK